MLIIQITPLYVCEYIIQRSGGYCHHLVVQWGRCLVSRNNMQILLEDALCLPGEEAQGAPYGARYEAFEEAQEA